jgi:hypothetical protein
MSLCLHVVDGYATPLKLEYDVQCVDDTLGSLLVRIGDVVVVMAELTGM